MFNKNKMIQWIKKSLETDKFSIEEQGNSEEGDGCIGEINFVKVNVNDPKKEEKELFLVVKVSKPDSKIRNLSSLLCRIEVIFYSEVFPILDKFQKEKNFPFNSIPICYKAFIEEDNEIVVMENLKTRGYEMHHNTEPLNLNHIKLVLKNFAKFHSISFALSDQRKHLFKQMEEKFKYSLIDTVDSFKPMYDKFEAKAVNYLIEVGQKDLAQKLAKIMEKGLYNTLKNSIDDIPEKRVVLHGDCHSQNMLFKYQDGDKENPLAMAFIDFQFSGINSPMTDLSYFLYRTASAEVLPHFKELIEVYYKELSSSVTELGSDINKSFPISKMWEHWEKYSLYGFIISTSFMDVFYSEGMIDLADLLDVTKNEIVIKMNAENKRAFLERLSVALAIALVKAAKGSPNSISTGSLELITSKSKCQENIFPCNKESADNSSVKAGPAQRNVTFSHCYSQGTIKRDAPKENDFYARLMDSVLNANSIEANNSPVQVPAKPDKTFLLSKDSVSNGSNKNTTLKNKKSCNDIESLEQTKTLNQNNDIKEDKHFQKHFSNYDLNEDINLRYAIKLLGMIREIKVTKERQTLQKELNQVADTKIVTKFLNERRINEVKEERNIYQRIKNVQFLQHARC